MAKVKGIGGVFFKAKDPVKLQTWYVEHLGITPEMDGYVSFWWKQTENPEDQYTVWSPFPEDTRYFEPSNAPFMINYIVDDLDSLLAELRARGVLPFYSLAKKVSLHRSNAAVDHQSYDAASRRQQDSNGHPMLKR